MTTRTGMARYPQTHLQTSNFCVAYLDILGGTNKICNDNDNTFLNHLNMIFSDLLNEAKFVANIKQEDIFVKIFSDNILFAVELGNNIATNADKVECIIKLVSNSQNEALNYGCLLRGAIVEDQFFHNNLIVYGKALVRAVKLEEKLAHYPRIIVDDTLVGLLPQYFLQDRDGRFFVNHFLTTQLFEPINFKIRLLNMLELNKNDERIKEKILWMINYYNYWFNIPKAECLEKYQITKKDIENAINYKESLSE